MNPFSTPTAVKIAQKELAEAERYLLQAHTNQESWAAEVGRRQTQIARLTQFIAERTAAATPPNPHTKISDVNVGSGEFA